MFFFLKALLTTSWEMKLLANGIVGKLAKWWDPILNNLLVVERGKERGRKEARGSVKKVTWATHG